MPLTPKQLIKLLKQNGFEEVSQNGSHLKMRNPATKKQVEIPMHSKELKKGTEQGILKGAGLK
ncbi:MAG: type II toxin-antitoxin system HicA family toxin [Clostridiales bacterium]|jgi:predicted RNA binding protein YcfA (HicA-like mRNA interferase family)|nr:type II toxin-antitoxin system HicA family toxin [Clostridiales bacterium]